MHNEEVYQLYHENPKPGFYFMRLIVERLPVDLQDHKVAAEAS